MGFTIEHLPDSGITRIVVEGELDSKLAMNCASEALAARKDDEPVRLLVDVTHAQVPDTPVEIYNFPKRLLEAGLTLRDKVAVVYSQDAESHLFAETVGQSGSLAVVMFTSAQPAMDWLGAS